ncbi:unnamed protein product [Scytosiphon promiscuus]
MSWKDRQRNRVPTVDLDDNPFCVERRMNEERHMMQLNRARKLESNPSLVHLTSADIPRTASFMVDAEKPFRDLSRKRRNLLAWSLRAASPSDRAVAQGKAGQERKPTLRTSVTVPSDLGSVSLDEFFDKEPGHPGHGCAAARSDVDIDTLPHLEPYRREVAAQQPITFGHRPLSASRMFNPCTMATSCGIQSGKKLNGRGTGVRAGGIISTRRSRSGTRRQTSLKRSRGRDRDNKTHGVTGISPPMLKALLRGDADLKSSVATVVHPCDAWKQGFPSAGGKSTRESVARETCLGVDVQEELSGSSVTREVVNESVWTSGGECGDLDATRFTNSSQEGLGQECLGLSDSVETLELQRIFSCQRPAWDGTPAPLPAPRDVRRAISSLLMPDPDERLRDKLIKSRKTAAGIPVTASSTKDERDKELERCDTMPSGRWEVCPPTPRAIIARGEIRRLADSRLERDSVMAERVRKAELSVFFTKIAASEKLYQRTLRVAQGRFQHETASTA